MRVLLINSVCGIRSTGRICTDIADELSAQGHDVKIAYGREEVPDEYQKYAIRIGSNIGVKINGLKARLFDNEGLNAKTATKKFLKWADGYNPDLVWLHNIHGYYINYELLFAWIKSRPNMQVKWTLHDCWAFTGHCSHFDYIKCNKWKNQCGNCPQKKDYPKSIIFDNSKVNYEKKKASFTGGNNMTLITPSNWLKGIVEKSFLRDYPVEVIHNKIDTEIFKPTPSDIKIRLGISDKRIILGVASAWSRKKGLEDLCKLSELLDDNYKIVLVGLTKKQLKQLPEKILGIVRTNSKKELAELYTAAEVFLNLTYEDTFPTVNLEAQACGTPVITYRTGGSVESVPTENVVEQGKLELAYELIKKSVK